VLIERISLNMENVKHLILSAILQEILRNNDTSIGFILFSLVSAIGRDARFDSTLEIVFMLLKCELLLESGCS